MAIRVCHSAAILAVVLFVTILSPAQPLPKSDTAAPTLKFWPIYDGQTVSGTFYIQALATDNDSVASVRLAVDDQDPVNLSDYPYFFFFDSRILADGAHQLRFTAADRTGNTTSQALTLLVDNSIYAGQDPFGPDPVTGFRTAEVTSTRVRFQWNAAADNVGATHYAVLRDGVPVGDVSSGALEFTDDGLSPGATYTYQVQAFDAAGNASDLSSPLALVTKQQDGNVLTVGPNGQYAKPCDAFRNAVPWDTVEIDAAGNGTYDGDVCQFRIHNLTIRGVNGRARIDAAGKASQGKATWVVSGNNDTIENVEMSGSKVADKNGAAIRGEGVNLTLRNVYFHHNENGILTGVAAGSTIRIEYSEFAYNGFGDGYSHNMYIGEVDRFILQFSYSHHCKEGQLVKSRAHENRILYNRLTDEDGSASYETDLPNGGLSYIIGNSFEQSSTTGNSTMIAYGEEGITAGHPSLLYVVNNTLVNDNHSVIFLNAARSTSPVLFQNNLYAGSETLITTPQTPLQDLANVPIAKSFFYDPYLTFDFRVTNDNPAASAGAPPATDTEGNSLAPLFEYVHPLGGRVRQEYSFTDAGAFRAQ